MHAATRDAVPEILRRRACDAHRDEDVPRLRDAIDALLRIHPTSVYGYLLLRDAALMDRHPDEAAKAAATARRLLAAGADRLIVPKHSIHD